MNNLCNNLFKIYVSQNKKSMLNLIWLILKQIDWKQILLAVILRRLFKIIF